MHQYKTYAMASNCGPHAKHGLLGSKSQGPHAKHGLPNSLSWGPCHYMLRLHATGPHAKHGLLGSKSQGPHAKHGLPVKQQPKSPFNRFFKIIYNHSDPTDKLIEELIALHSSIRAVYHDQRASKRSYGIPGYLLPRELDKKSLEYHDMCCDSALLPGIKFHKERNQFHFMPFITPRDMREDLYKAAIDFMFGIIFIGYYFFDKNFLGFFETYFSVTNHKSPCLSCDYIREHKERDTGYYKRVYLYQNFCPKTIAFYTEFDFSPMEYVIQKFFDDHCGDDFLVVRNSILAVIKSKNEPKKYYNSLWVEIEIPHKLVVGQDLTDSESETDNSTYQCDSDDDGYNSGAWLKKKYGKYGW